MTAETARENGTATAAPDLWRAIFGEGEGYLCVASGGREGQAGPGLVGFREAYFLYPGEADRAARWCAAESGSGREVYFCAHLLTGPRRRKGDAAPVRALWADGDGATLPEGFPEPSVTVESSPGRTQLYWALDEPVEPAAAERLNKRIILATGADPSGYDLTQLLRPPGTANRKYEGTPEVVVKEATGELHNPARLDKVLPGLPAPPEKGPYDGPPDAGFALEEWLDRFPEAQGAVIGERGDDVARAKYATVCPWVEEHTGGDQSGTVVGQFGSGALFFACRHAHCEGRGWPEYRAFYDPPEGPGDYPEVTFVADMPDAGVPGGVPNVPPTAVPTVPDAAGTRRTLPLVPPFPVDALPPDLARFVREAAAEIVCRPEFVANPMLAALASAAGASRVLAVKGKWREFPSLWVATVAEPSEKKSPGYDRATEPVWDEQSRLQTRHEYLSGRHEESLLVWEVAKRTTPKGETPPPKPEEPELGHVVTQDSTIERLVEMLVENGRGLFVAHDELSGWFSGMDQYKPGGKGNERQKYLQMWSSSPVKVDRKSGALYARTPVVSIAGSLQPAVLPSMTLPGGADDGMRARFLISAPAPLRVLDDWSDEEVCPSTELRYGFVFQQLRGLEPDEDGGPRVVRFTDAGKARFREENRLTRAEQFVPGFPRHLAYAWNKMPSQLARLSLLFALVRCATGEAGAEEAVTGDDVGRAAELVGYYKAHARRVFVISGGETRDQRWLRAVNALLDEHGERWRVPSEALRLELRELGVHDAPDRAEDLTRELLELAARTPGLAVKKAGGRVDGQRALDLLRTSRAYDDISGTVGTVYGGAAQDTPGGTVGPGPEDPPKAAELIVFALRGAREAGMFRKEIADASGLALKTVKNNVTALVKEGRVEEFGETENQTRRVRLYEYRPIHDNLTMIEKGSDDEEGAA